MLSSRADRLCLGIMKLSTSCRFSILSVFLLSTPYEAILDLIVKFIQFDCDSICHTSQLSNRAAVRFHLSRLPCYMPHSSYSHPPPLLQYSLYFQWTIFIRHQLVLFVFLYFLVAHSSSLLLLSASFAVQKCCHYFVAIIFVFLFCSRLVSPHQPRIQNFMYFLIWLISLYVSTIQRCIFLSIQFSIMVSWFALLVRMVGWVFSGWLPKRLVSLVVVCVSLLAQVVPLTDQNILIGRNFKVATRMSIEALEK